MMTKSSEVHWSIDPVLLVTGLFVGVVLGMVINPFLVMVILQPWLAGVQIYLQIAHVILVFYLSARLTAYLKREEEFGASDISQQCCSQFSYAITAGYLINVLCTYVAASNVPAMYIAI